MYGSYRLIAFFTKLKKVKFFVENMINRAVSAKLLDFASIKIELSRGRKSKIKIMRKSFIKETGYFGFIYRELTMRDLF